MMATPALKAAAPEGKPIDTPEDVALVEAQALLSWIHSQFGRSPRTSWEDAPWQERRRALKQAAQELGFAA
jgi:hypothetical protein